MMDVVAALLMLPTLAGVLAALRTAGAEVQSVLDDGLRPPRWLESVAPLKGRWLRLVLHLPVLAFRCACTFSLAFLLTAFASGVFFALPTVLLGLR